MPGAHNSGKTAKLLRAALAGPVSVLDDGSVRLAPAGRGRPLMFASEIVEKMISDGILKSSGCRTVEPGPEAVAWLRRFEAGDDHPFRHQHSAYMSKESLPDPETRKTVLRDENPVIWLYRRAGSGKADGLHAVGRTHVIAAERLRSDFEKGNITLGVRSNWLSPVGCVTQTRSAAGETSSKLSDMALSARERFRRAVDYARPEFGPVLVRVCCHSESLEDLEKHYKWPRRSAKIILGLALNRLARHYGIGEQPKDNRFSG